MQNRRTRTALLALAAGAAATLSACGESTGAETGHLTVQLTDAPFPYQDVARVDVWVVRIDARREDDAMRGVVLLDLPDHDSTEVSHHLEVDRLVELADLMIWVLDPQKYADAAVHDRYLRPLATHREVMLLILNHVDTVPTERRESMLADIRRHTS